MWTQTHIIGRGHIGALLLCCAVIAGTVAQPLLSIPASAQAAAMGGIGASDTITLRATVQSVDLNTRTVVLVGPQGSVLPLKVGDDVPNLAQLKPGGEVVARYHASVAFILAGPGTKTPGNSLTTAAAVAAPGQSPGAAAALKLVVTGVVVGVDTATNTLRLVNPAGGAIRTVKVLSREGQQNMAAIKVGDTITAVVSEALAIALDPA